MSGELRWRKDLSEGRQEPSPDLWLELGEALDYWMECFPVGQLRNSDGPKGASAVYFGCELDWLDCWRCGWSFELGRRGLRCELQAPDRQELLVERASGRVLVYLPGSAATARLLLLETQSSSRYFYS